MVFQSLHQIQAIGQMVDNLSMDEINGLHIAVLIISGLTVLLLLLFLFRSGNRSAKNRVNPAEKPGTPKPEGGRTCPLCGELLKKGEKVHSVLYPGKPDSLMEIYGCPYCEAAPKAREGQTKNRRICPVCKKEMSRDSVLIARVFEKPGKKHVHVLGCSSCYSGRSTPGKA